MNRNEVIEYLAKYKIQSRPIWGLIHEQLPYKSSQNYKIEKAFDYYAHVVNIPCGSNLKKEQIECILKKLAQ